MKFNTKNAKIKSLNIDDKVYVVDEDLNIEIDEKHIDIVKSLGFTKVLTEAVEPVEKAEKKTNKKGS